jgi:hypothetical protein
LDVAPTLLATVGARALDSDGRDLRPLWEAPDAGGDPPAAYVETLATHLDYGWSPLVGLRTERFKYIRAPRPELYDLAADPGELHDLADRDPERVRRLDAALERRLASQGSASEPVPLSAVDRARLESLGYVVPAPTDASARGDGGLRPDRAGGPDPKDELPLLELVAASRRASVSGRYEEAWSRLAQIDDPPLHLLAIRASAAFNAGRPADAARDARRAIALEPRRLDVLVILGRALEAVGDLPGARQLVVHEALEMIWCFAGS